MSWDKLNHQRPFEIFIRLLTVFVLLFLVLILLFRYLRKCVRGLPVDCPTRERLESAFRKSLCLAKINWTSELWDFTKVCHFSWETGNMCGSLQYL